jgi:hypothetical protein
VPRPELLPALLVALVTVLVAVATGARVTARRGADDGLRAAGWVLLAGAVAAALLVTLVPVAGPPPAPEGVSAAVNLVPLRDLRALLGSGNARRAAVEVGGNLLLLAPVGFLLALLRRRPGTAVVVCALLSAGLEALQHVIGRAADVDDVLVNTAGGALGVLLALAVRALRARRRHPDGGAPGRA